jgi:glucoamylase
MKILLLAKLTISLYWISKQYDFAIQSILNNISPPGTLQGTVVASPSKFKPDYYYMWVRDAGIVMRSLLMEELDVGKLYNDYANISTFEQESDLPAGLGEPKFHVDGKVFRGPWGRPQNDGPALRVLARHSYGELYDIMITGIYRSSINKASNDTNTIFLESTKNWG